MDNGRMKRRVKGYLLKNIGDLSGKTIFITGGSGIIGRCITEELALLNANLILGVRNMDKGVELVASLKKNFPLLNIQLLSLDMNDYASIMNCIEALKPYSLDYVILNHAISKSSTKNAYFVEEHVFVNFYACYLFMQGLGKHIPYIVMGSVCYKKELKRLLREEEVKDDYAYSKGLLMRLCYKLKKEYQYDITISNPGISYTGLFYERHKNIRVLLQMLKPLLMRNETAALAVLYGIHKTTEVDEWISPRGLWNVFGYPRVKKMEKSFFTDKNIEQIKFKIEEINQIMEEKI